MLFDVRGAGGGGGGGGNKTKRDSFTYSGN